MLAEAAPTLAPANAATPPTCEPAREPDPLAWAHPLTRDWFLARFGSPTEPQLAGWPAILRGDPTLISAPTGSGKTLAAFLVCIDRLLRQALAGALAPQTQILYISPLKALSNDVQKNLDAPLAEIAELALARGLLCPAIRTAVRTGDTPQKDRAAMLRHPPHILVTTPESLYLLLTAHKSRANLRHVHTVIVDEIHAVADDKRGAHLALSLERLEALIRNENPLAQPPNEPRTTNNKPPQRIGLSATQNPIELVASFLTGAHPTRPPATVVQVGNRRTLDLAIEIPSAELTSLATTAMWTELYDRLAALALAHRSTLVFVNTRRLVEKLSFELAERLGPTLGPGAVGAHHGSLSRTLRLDAEQRLKSGELRILIATASLELGIDIGAVDLVCQIQSTRAIATAMQRVGRAGHWRGAVPKGRFFALTRDDLLEQAALLQQMTAGNLDRLEIPDAPLDVLMQQIVASCGAESWHEETLFRTLRRAWPYRALAREAFHELLHLLHNGIESSRGRYGAYLLRDQVHGHLHARRGARSIAIANGGAIPDASLYAVMLQPENVQIATLDEHFAVDSHPGDVVLLGNTPWRIQRIDPAGKVLVEDAHGAPPNIPFWEGEAPGRTAELSAAVSNLRAEIDRRTSTLKPSQITANPHHLELQTTLAWLQTSCHLCPSVALQLIAYIVAGRSILGAVPTQTTLIAERFFDEGGGQQLILHAPFGSRLNKAWGLALRKRFCRGFNFELQAAATDNGINISLAEQHSFPLADVFTFLTEGTARELLEQAAIPSPLFKNRWRWAAARSLQLLRFQKGKRVAPQIQRIRSDDLLASVFPHASACPETMSGDIEIPDHPLVREVMRDTLTEAMDIDGLESLLRAIADGSIQTLAVDTPVPSQFAHELLNAMPYAFLDEADAAARRTRAVTLRRTLPDAVTEAAGRLDPVAIDTVRQTLFPDPRDQHELHDLLLQLTALPLTLLDQHPAAKANWPQLFVQLAEQGRAHLIHLAPNAPAWLATERLPDAQLLWPHLPLPGTAPHLATPREPSTLAGTEYRPAQPLSPADNATRSLVHGWLQLLGPLTAASLAELLHLPAAPLTQALLVAEMQGLALRGVYELPKPAPDADPSLTEWCERRILQRIHRLTLAGLRQSVEPVTPVIFNRWLQDWHHVQPSTEYQPPSTNHHPPSTEEALLAALEQLEGFEAPASEWERAILPARVPNYNPRDLDNLCLAGIVGWGRLSPHPAWSQTDGLAPRRVIPTGAAPITFFLRESADWLPSTLAANCPSEPALQQSLSPEAQHLRHLLATQGAAFTADLQRLTSLPKQTVNTALWELATAGLASADGFDQLRALMDPRRKSVHLAQTPATSLRKRAQARTTAGRWSLLCPPNLQPTHPEHQSQHIAAAKQHQSALDAHARILLNRYGVLFRELLTREPNAPKWRDLAPILRQLEARGEIRGGRFVSGPFGEQFALPEAVDALRQARRQHPSRAAEPPLTLAAADPLNLLGILIPGDRPPAIPGREVTFQNGAAPTPTIPEPAATPIKQPKATRSLADLLRREATRATPTPPPPPTSIGLFP